MTKRLHFHFSLSCIGEGNGNPLQCSCLENPRDGEACWAAIYGVPQSQTRLQQLSSSSSEVRWEPGKRLWDPMASNTRFHPGWTQATRGWGDLLAQIVISMAGTTSVLPFQITPGWAPPSGLDAWWVELGQSLHPTTMEIKVGGLFTFSSEKPAAPKRVTEGNPQS